jgi:acyl-CoA synthetase (AMP-forming)/AMP-acid ligase II/acyl carrier protein
MLGDGQQVRPDTSLFDLAGFNSLAVAELVERLEEQIGMEIPPALLVPQTFETPATLSTAVARLHRPCAATPDDRAVSSGRLDRRSALVHDLLDSAAADAGHRTAIRSRERELTYDALQRRSIEVAARLVEAGVGEGDRVLVATGNTVATVEYLYALSRVRAVFVPVDPEAPAPAVEHIAADVGASAIARPEGVDRPGGSAGSPRSSAGSPSAADPALIFYTSGSTGRPKGIVCPHRSVLHAVDAISSRIAFVADDVFGCVLPLTFDYGLYQVLLATGARATLALGSAADAGPQLVAFLDTYAVTGLPLVPSLADTLVRLVARRSAERRPRLRWITNTGAALPESSARNLRRSLPDARLYLMYGLTECKRVSILLPDEWAERPRSVGRPLDGTDVTVVDPVTGVRLDAGRTGEIVVRGQHVMAGYWGEPTGEGRTFRPSDDDGGPVLHTGDLGHLDEGGYLYVDGRMDDMYKSSGFRVYPLEIELAAAALDGVRESTLLRPTEDRPATLVVAADEPVSAGDVRARLAALLEPFKVPERVIVLRDLPHGINGKVDRARLAASIGGGT